MPRFRFIAALLALAGAPTLWSQTDQALWRYLHPNAKALVSLDWKRFRQSQLGTMFRDKWLDKAGEGGAALPGIEFLDDVDRFLFSSPGRKPDEDASSQAPLLVVASGHFDLTKVRNALIAYGTKPQMFNSIEVYRPQGSSGQDMALVPLDDRTILIGDAASVFASLERNQFPPAPPDANSAMARAAEMENNYDIWALITDPSILASNPVTEKFSGGELGGEVRGLEAGLSLRSGLAADIKVRFDDESGANKLVTVIGGLLGMMGKSKASQPALQELTRRLKFTAEGEVARISLRLTQQQLEKNTKVFTASRLPANDPFAGIRAAVKPALASPSPAPQVALPPAPPPPPEKKVIRIEGLDEGTRIIPYSDR